MKRKAILGKINGKARSKGKGGLLNTPEEGSLKNGGGRGTLNGEEKKKQIGCPSGVIFAGTLTYPKGNTQKPAISQTNRIAAYLFTFKKRNEKKTERVSVSKWGGQYRPQHGLLTGKKKFIGWRVTKDLENVDLGEGHCGSCKVFLATRRLGAAFRPKGRTLSRESRSGRAIHKNLLNIARKGKWRSGT